MKHLGLLFLMMVVAIGAAAAPAVGETSTMAISPIA